MVVRRRWIVVNRRGQFEVEHQAAVMIGLVVVVVVVVVEEEEELEEGVGRVAAAAAAAAVGQVWGGALMG